MTFWISPSTVSNDSVTPYNTGRERSTDQTGVETMVAPLHPLAATTSASVRPVTNSGRVVYSRTGDGSNKKKKHHKKVKKYSQPVGMETASPALYNNGYGIIERPDNRGFLKTKRSKKQHTEAFSRTGLIILETETPEHDPPHGLIGKGSGRLPKGAKIADFKPKPKSPGSLTSADSDRLNAIALAAEKSRQREEPLGLDEPTESVFVRRETLVLEKTNER